MAKILLAEDEVNIASFIERGLKEFGHSVTVCHDGNTGWRILQEEPFDLVVLDIIMPKINGLELCHLYRQMFGYQAPVIMLTALGTTEDIVKGLDAGADDYLVFQFSGTGSTYQGAAATKQGDCNQSTDLRQSGIGL